MHSREAYENSVKASQVLFSKNFIEDINTINETLFLEVFEGVPTKELPLKMLDEGIDMIAALSAQTGFLNSNGEARRALKENAVGVNKVKIKEDYKLSKSDLIHGKYITINKGKKNTYIIKFN